ncbi:hypothetical protein GOP47_0029263, partial [Adiantum capillus-veneris]
MKIEAKEEGCSSHGSTRLEHTINILDAEEMHGICVESSTSEQRHTLLTDHRGDGQGITQRATFSGNAIADSFVCTRFIFILLRFFGMGYRWMMNMAALFLYGIFVLPGVLQVGWRYFSDKRIHRGIPYGKDARNKFDLYLPDMLETRRPVVVFVSGGAWIIGYKAWGSLLALQLVEEDVIVACMDYRNFPQGTIGDMVEDVSQAISFICNKISDYGGDIERLYLVGQSAGAHLGACTLINQAKKEYDTITMCTSQEEIERGEFLLPWRASQFKGYIGISGGYDLIKLADHFHGKGMNRNLFLRIMEGEDSLALYSPEICLQSFENVSRFLPPFYLFHGTKDHSIPYISSTTFVEALRSAGVQATITLYEGKSHTDVFLQDPMRGGYNALLEDVLVVLDVGDTKDPSTRLQRRLVPECFLKLAHLV